MLMTACSADGASPSDEGAPSAAEPKGNDSTDRNAPANDDADAAPPAPTPAPPATPPGANGGRHTLYINGRDPGGTPNEWDYWGGARPGVDPIPVNWDGRQRVADSNATVRDALDNYCRGDNECYLACHSAGCAQVGYALAMFGQEGGADRWNILWVATAGSAEGGSELAETPNMFGEGVPLDQDLRVGTMRQLYAHDNTAGVKLFMFAGAGYSDAHPSYGAGGPFLPGDDDLAVAYHSALGVSNTAFQKEDAWCNKTSFFCPGKVIDEGAHSYQWPNHEVQYLDLKSDYSHFLADSNGGICTEMFRYMEENAR